MSANPQVTPPQVAQGQQGQVAPQLPPPGQGHQHDAGQLPPPLLAGQGHPQVIPGWLPPQGNAQQGPGSSYKDISNTIRLRTMLDKLHNLIRGLAREFTMLR